MSTFWPPTYREALHWLLLSMLKKDKQTLLRLMEQSHKLREEIKSLNAGKWNHVYNKYTGKKDDVESPQARMITLESLHMDIRARIDLLQGLTE